MQGLRDRGKTIVLTTHYMEEAEVLCDRVAIMEAGRIVAIDTPAQLVAQHGGGLVIRCRFTGPVARADLAALPGILEATGPDGTDGRYTFRTAEASTAPSSPSSTSPSAPTPPSPTSRSTNPASKTSSSTSPAAPSATKWQLLR
ncbi:MAG: hypothetical protein U0841_32060 [Chloroflexia bacterium]